MPMAVAAGILRDFAGSHFLGLETAALVAASFVLDLLVQKIDRDSPVMRMAVGFLFVFLVSILVVVFSNFLGGAREISWYTFQISAGAALYSAAVLPPFIYVTGRWFHDRVPLKQYELFG